MVAANQEITLLVFGLQFFGLAGLSADQLDTPGWDP